MSTFKINNIIGNDDAELLVGRLVKSNVVQTHLTAPSIQAISANIVTNITDLNASITLSRKEHRVKVTVRWSGEWSAINNYDCVFGLNRNDIAVGNPTNPSFRMAGIASTEQGYYTSDASTTQDTIRFVFIDTPNTLDPITYTATVKKSVSGTMYNQRVVSGSDLTYAERLTSTIILEEIV